MRIPGGAARPVEYLPGQLLGSLRREQLRFGAPCFGSRFAMTADRENAPSSAREHDNSILESAQSDGYHCSSLLREPIIPHAWIDSAGWVVRGGTMQFPGFACETEGQAASGWSQLEEPVPLRIRTFGAGTELHSAFWIHSGTFRSVPPLRRRSAWRRFRGPFQTAAGA
jgi:hypothetical protein